MYGPPDAFLQKALTNSTAMKLARGGITDTGTAIDGLTSIMNSYGMAAG